MKKEYLTLTELSTKCPYKGTARYWTIKVGNKVAENAVWNYPNPIDTCPNIANHVAFYWHKVDHWYEEGESLIVFLSYLPRKKYNSFVALDEEVFVHARDPFSRVDTALSSRHVQVYHEGVLLADTHRAVFLFEVSPCLSSGPEADTRMHCQLRYTLRG